MERSNLCVKVIEVYAKRLYTPTKIPGVKYTVNQYVGCEHACLYCYSKFVCRWKRYGEWGTWVEAKVNAPQLAKKYVEGRVSMSTVSDPYQPVEKKLRLTQGVLEAMDKRIKLSVLTKSDLVTRDIELFKKFERIEIGLTVNGFVDQVKKVFEPNSPSHSQRMAALKVLVDEGVRTYAFISPAIPELVNVESLLTELRGLVEVVYVEVLNLRLSGSKFRAALHQLAPKGYDLLTKHHQSYVEKLIDEVKRSNIPHAKVVVHHSRFAVLDVC